MALHLLLMPVSGAGTVVSPRAPKYAASVDGSGWIMVDGGTACVILVDVSAAVLTTMLANADCVELPIAALKVAPNALTAAKAATILSGLVVPPGATSQKIASLPVEHTQPTLAGVNILLNIASAGAVTLPV
jgi:hypothetical protein